MRGGEQRPGPVDYLPADQAGYRTLAPPPQETVPRRPLKKKLPPRHFDDAEPQTFVTPTTKYPPPRHLKTPGDAPRPDPGPFPVLKRVKTGEYQGFPYPPGPEKQHKQRGKSRSYDKRRYRQKRQKLKHRSKLWYQRMKNRPDVKRDRKRRREHPEKFHRVPGGGSTDPADRAKEWRKNQRDAGTFFIVEKGDPDSRDERPRRQLQQDSPDVPWHQVLDEGPNYNETGPWRAEPPLRAIRGAGSLLAVARDTSGMLQRRSLGLLVMRSGISPRGYMEFQVSGSSGVMRRVRLAGTPGHWEAASCSCPFWVFGGPEYHARHGGYLLGAPRGLDKAPKVRDPDGTNLLCKHVLAALRWGRKQKQGRSTSVPTYNMKCQDCGAGRQAVLAASARPETPCPTCRQGTMVAAPPDRVGFAQRGDDWVGRAQKLRAQMAARQARVEKAQEEQRRELPRLQPNVEGLRTDTWAEAARLARSQGLDATSYEERARKEDPR